MNRKQRRTAASSKGQGKELRQAMAKVQGSLAIINASNLDKLPEAINGLQDQTKRASLLADALSDDYETLLKRINIQEILLEAILGDTFESKLQKAEAILEARLAEDSNPESV